MTTKRCGRCKKSKPASEFYPRPLRNGGVGLHSYCKSCKREYSREWSEANKEARKATRRDYYYRAVKTDAERMKRRRANDRERARRRRKENPAQLAENSRRWRERVLADPEWHTRMVVSRRIGERLAKEATTGRLEGAFRTAKAVESYRAPSNKGTLSAEPFVAWIRAEFPGASTGTIAAALRLPERRIFALLSGEQRLIGLDSVDRAVTLGLGRPDLLDRLYPMESA